MLMKKKFFTLLFAVVASYGMINAEVVNGTCGENLTWSFNTESGLLSIEGSGMMNDYYYGFWGYWNEAPETPWKAYATQIQTITLPVGLSSIGSGAFQDCSVIQSIVIPNSVQTIGKGAFCRCKSLQSIILGTGVQSVQTGAFIECENLLSVSFNQQLTKIEEMAFAFCKKLNSIAFQNDLREIEENAFEDCIALTSITFPNSLITLNGFYGCTGITSIVVPNSVTRIGRNAFADCNNLKSLTIGSGVESIGGNAFYACSGLTSVTCLATTPPKMSIEYSVQPCDGCAEPLIEEYIDESSPVFEDVVCYNIPLYVPAESIKAYQHTDQWKEFDPIQAIQNSEGIEEAMSAKAKNAKVIYEGQVLIERGDKTYTLTGQEVK